MDGPPRRSRACPPCRRGLWPPGSRSKGPLLRRPAWSPALTLGAPPTPGSRYRMGPTPTRPEALTLAQTAEVCRARQAPGSSLLQGSTCWGRGVRPKPRSHPDPPARTAHLPVTAAPGRTGTPPSCAEQGAGRATVLHGGGGSRGRDQIAHGGVPWVVGEAGRGSHRGGTSLERSISGRQVLVFRAHPGYSLVADCWFSDF